VSKQTYTQGHEYQIIRKDPTTGKWLTVFGERYNSIEQVERRLDTLRTIYKRTEYRKKVIKVA
jgi:gamma-glutamylcyclotransferase (GGCT)/AIG2-like uncharacterized protein YtfP